MKNMRFKISCETAEVELYVWEEDNSHEYQNGYWKYLKDFDTALEAKEYAQKYKDSAFEEVFTL